MELRHLRYFVAVAERLSFTQAADTVHVTQSTLSHQIKQLEDQLGQRLFQRVGRRVMLTEGGSIFLAHASAALREVDHGVRTVRQTSAQPNGEIRIGAGQSFCIRFIPECIASFLVTHPTMRIVVEEASASQIDSQLRGDEIDLAVAYRPNDTTDVSFEALYNEEMVLVVPKGHALAKRRRVRMVELHNEPLVMLSKGFATRSLLDKHFRSLQVEPNVIVETNGLATVFAVARRLKIAAIVSEYSAVDAPGLIPIALEAPTPLRTFGIIRKRDAQQSAAVRSFAATIRRTALEAKVRKPSLS
jgi:LysR family transcriptional regulator, cyn operon transcriptional activator